MYEYVLLSKSSCTYVCIFTIFIHTCILPLCMYVGVEVSFDIVTSYKVYKTPFHRCWWLIFLNILNSQIVSFLVCI